MYRSNSGRVGSYDQSIDQPVNPDRLESIAWSIEEPADWMEPGGGLLTVARTSPS